MNPILGCSSQLQSLRCSFATFGLIATLWTFVMPVHRIKRIVVTHLAEVLYRTDFATISLVRIHAGTLSGVSFLILRALRACSLALACSCWKRCHARSILPLSLVQSSQILHAPISGRVVLQTWHFSHFFFSPPLPVVRIGVATGAGLDSCCLFKLLERLLGCRIIAF